MGFPLSDVSSCASSAVFDSMSCESLYIMRPRSRAEIFDHLPSKARRAASTALSMSALSPSATSASFCPVAGFGESNVLPDSASTHCPSINSWYLRGVSDAGCVDDINCTPSVLAADSGCELSLRCRQLYHKGG